MSTGKIRFCSRNEKAFPSALYNIPDPPGGLYYRGDITAAGRNICVAFTGSRDPSETGLEAAFLAGKTAADMGICVVSGLAPGCDTAVLRGALSAGGTCIAVLPCGLDQTIPRSNGSLAEEILRAGGCLISETEPYAPVHKYMYVKRDRLISGLCPGTIIIEASINNSAGISR